MRTCPPIFFFFFLLIKSWVVWEGMRNGNLFFWTIILGHPILHCRGGGGDGDRDGGDADRDDGGGDGGGDGSGKW